MFITKGEACVAYSVANKDNHIIYYYRKILLTQSYHAYIHNLMEISDSYSINFTALHEHAMNEGYVNCDNVPIVLLH